MFEGRNKASAGLAPRTDATMYISTVTLWSLVRISLCGPQNGTHHSHFPRHRNIVLNVRKVSKYRFVDVYYVRVSLLGSTWICKKWLSYDVDL